MLGAGCWGLGAGVVGWWVSQQQARGRLSEPLFASEATYSFYAAKVADLWPLPLPVWGPRGVAGHAGAMHSCVFPGRAGQRETLPDLELPPSHRQGSSQLPGRRWGVWGETAGAGRVHGTSVEGPKGCGLHCGHWEMKPRPGHQVTGGRKDNDDHGRLHERAIRVDPLSPHSGDP